MGKFSHIAEERKRDREQVVRGSSLMKENSKEQTPCTGAVSFGISKRHARNISLCVALIIDTRTLVSLWVHHRSSSKFGIVSTEKIRMDDRSLFSIEGDKIFGYATCHSPARFL